MNHFNNDYKEAENVISDLEKLSEKIMFAYERLIKGKTKQEEEIIKYKTIIQSLLSSGLEYTQSIFIKLAIDENVAHSIRMQTIESIGIIGRHENLKELLILAKHLDPEIRECALISISMILSDKRNIIYYDPKKFDKASKTIEYEK